MTGREMWRVWMLAPGDSVWERHSGRVQSSRGEAEGIIEGEIRRRTASQRRVPSFALQLDGGELVSYPTAP